MIGFLLVESRLKPCLKHCVCCINKDKLWIFKIKLLAQPNSLRRFLLFLCMPIKGVSSQFRLVPS